MGEKRETVRRGANGLHGCSLLFLLLWCPRFPLAAQAILRAVPDSATFTERARAEVTTHAGGSEFRRVVAREARYAVTTAQDTAVVRATSFALSEASGGVTRSLDTDGFVGGRWKLVLVPNNSPSVVARPFVPPELAEVSDLASLMDDFFPSVPPRLAVDSSTVGAGRRRWQRLADSAGMERYRWVEEQQKNGNRALADSVPLMVQESSHEESVVVWDRSRGPMAWERQIHAVSISQIRGRTVSAVVDQHVVVSRVP